LKRNIEITELKISWLLDRDYQIDVPNNPIIKRKILRSISILCEGNAKTIQKVITGIGKTRFFFYKKDDYKIPEVHFKELSKILNETFKIPITKNGKKTHFFIDFKISDVDLLVPKVNKLSIDKAIEIRKQEPEKIYLKPTTIEEKEEISFKVCQMFASGRYLLRECCEKYDVYILDFIKWIVADVTIQQIYEESVKISQFITDSDMINLSAQMIIKRLQTGQIVSTEKIYKTKEEKGGKAPSLIEKSRKETIREIPIRDLISLIALMRNTRIEGLPDNDEYSNMSIDELKKMVQDMDGNS